MTTLRYWCFGEDHLMVALAKAAECGDITAEEAEIVRRFLHSAHARENKILLERNIAMPGGGL